MPKTDPGLAAALVAAARRVKAAQEPLDARRKAEGHTRTGRRRGRPSGSATKSRSPYDAQGEYVPDLDNDGDFRGPGRLARLDAELACAIALELARREPQPPARPQLRGALPPDYVRASELYLRGTGAHISPDSLKAKVTRAGLAAARALLDIRHRSISLTDSD